MEALEEATNNHNINLNSSSYNSSFHGYVLSASHVYFNATYTSSYNEWLIDYGAFYCMAKNKSIFSTLSKCNTKKIFFGDIS
jgi:hypothetical protein